MDGLGVNINKLFGDFGGEHVRSSIGKTIDSMDIQDDKLIIKFTDNTGIVLWDDGQSCCEHRYMVCDDKLSEFTGSKLVGVSVKNSDHTGSYEQYDVHEIEFLEISTDRGAISIANHNEHNGYYGGFSVKARSF